MTKDFLTQPYQLKIEKPWGYELILTPDSSAVVGKILHVNAGCRLSLQYHDKKEETLTLLSGEALLILEDGNEQLQEIKMESQKGYLIKPFQKHRLKGIGDCDVLETSTKEEGQTIRLEDDYHRETETEEERKTLHQG